MTKGTMNCRRYRPCPTAGLTGRTWPDKTITHAPVWCSVDLRDGNQALCTPMNVEEKTALFGLLVETGFREIEVGFPSASLVEYRFVRKLIEEDLIPDHVTIQVLTQARGHLIQKTFDAVAGAKNAIIHMYNSTSPAQREIVFRKSRQEVRDIAVSAAALMQDLRKRSGQPGIRFEYSPESFTATEPGYALEVCHAVMDIWKPTPEDRVIFNLPATVEVSTPNIYADRIEWFCRNVRDRGSAIISVHTHNDRGTAVAAAELAVMAGAERVEGALFGNGERTGNMDIITMAMNMYSQGVDPGLDFSRIDDMVSAYEKCTRIKVHERHPYAGALVYTAFSGSHQDAIHKGMKEQARSRGSIWNVPYLPIDPGDVGRSYRSVIRINSQSGKGGAAHVMERDWGFSIPKAMQPDFGEVVQKKTDRCGRELSSDELRRIFEEEYIPKKPAVDLQTCAIDEAGQKQADGKKEQTSVSVILDVRGNRMAFQSQGNGPADAFVQGIKKSTEMDFIIFLREGHARANGSAMEVAYAGIQTAEGARYYGAGMDKDKDMAFIRAVLSALNRCSSFSRQAW